MKSQIFTVVKKSKDSKQISEWIGSFVSLELANTLKNSFMENNISFYEIVRSDLYSSIEDFQADSDNEIVHKILRGLDDHQQSVLRRYFRRD